MIISKTPNGAAIALYIFMAVGIFVTTHPLDSKPLSTIKRRLDTALLALVFVVIVLVAICMIALEFTDHKWRKLNGNRKANAVRITIEFMIVIVPVLLALLVMGCLSLLPALKARMVGKKRRGLIPYNIGDA